MGVFYVGYSRVVRAGGQGKVTDSRVAFGLGAISKNPSQDKTPPLALFSDFQGHPCTGARARGSGGEHFPGLGAGSQFSHGFLVSRSLQQAADQPSLGDSEFFRAKVDFFFVSRTHARIRRNGSRLCWRATCRGITGAARKWPGRRFLSGSSHCISEPPMPQKLNPAHPCRSGLGNEWASWYQEV